MGRHRRCILLFLFLLSVYKSCDSCPSICTCKWKGGKESAECVNQGVATLPNGLEVQTQVLDFSGNNLQSLPRHAFLNKKLINLQRLHLKNCNLGEINRDALAQLTNLVDFDLSENLLTKIPFIAFKHVPALRVLNLAGNPITSIPGEAFVNTPSLVFLDLSNARISYVSPMAFQPLLSLEKLHIQGNNLQELPETAIKSIENAHEVTVHHNPWLCDCRALPLWRILEERRVPHTVSPSCKLPYRISERKFENLQEEDFACPPEIHPYIGVVHGVAGENATVTCIVEGQPSPDVIWKIENKQIINGSVLGLGPQRAYILNMGEKQKESHLVITGAQEDNSGQVQCIAVNPAGQAEANFTLVVIMRENDDDTLNSGHIAGISVSLVVLALIIFVVAFLLFARSRTTSTPTPAKESTPTCSVVSPPSEPNPIQKPPRLTDLTSSNSNDPDLISEAEKAREIYSNGRIPNGIDNPIIPGASNFAKMPSEGFYAGNSWDEKAAIFHEHYNPGFMIQDSPSRIGPTHSTPYKVIPEANFDPQTYGYPPDYGLPIPEANEDIYYDPKHETLSSTLTMDESSDPYMRAVAVPMRHTTVEDLFEKNKTGRKGRPASSEIHIHENFISDESGPGQRIDVAEGSSSPTINGPPAERPWVPGSQDTLPVVPLGVPVLPPLPTNALSRIKARDSPDEGYQEGTEV